MYYLNLIFKIIVSLFMCTLFFIVLSYLAMLFYVIYESPYLCEDECVRRFNKDILIEKEYVSELRYYYLLNDYSLKIPTISIYSYYKNNNVLYIIGQKYNKIDKNLYLYIVNIDDKSYSIFSDVNSLSKTDKELACSIDTNQSFFSYNILESLIKKEDIMILKDC